MLRKSLYLFIFCNISIALFIIIGHFQPTPHSIEILDSLICYFNDCSVGHSNDLNIIVDAIESNESGNIPFEIYEVRYFRSIHNRDVLILLVESTTNRGLFSLGDLIAHHSEPCSVTITEDEIQFQYPDFFASIPATYNIRDSRTRTLNISPHMRIQYVRLPIVSSCETPITNATSYNVTSQWHGFRSINYYISHRNQQVGDGL
jgi:hypothetical protein